MIYKMVTTGVIIYDKNIACFLGIALRGGACKKNKAIGLVEDNGGFKGIKTGAHELGHL